MKRVLLFAGACAPSTLLMSAAVGQIVAPPAGPYPPPIMATPAPPRQTLLAWIPGEVRCGGQVVAAVPMRRPWTSLSWASNGSFDDPPKPVSLRFRLDATGRPLSIARQSSGYAPYGDDIAPSLAATHFDSDGARSGCSVTYTARRIPLDQAPIADLVSYSVNPTAGPLPRIGWDRIAPEGATCLAAPRPQPLTQVYPDFRTMPRTPGVRDWSMIVYDQDARGRPIHVRVVHSTQNTALDTASVKAVAASRYTGGARTGCVFRYWNGAQKIVAPSPPDRESLRPADSNCADAEGWANRPALIYPDAYRRRSIEGWAIVAFDVAPWGDTGNVRVLASEPSVDFGDQAMRLIRNAKKAPSRAGRIGCVDTVRFVMGPVDGPQVDESPPPPF